MHPAQQIWRRLKTPSFIALFIYFLSFLLLCEYWILLCSMSVILCSSLQESICLLGTTTAQLATGRAALPLVHHQACELYLTSPETLQLQQPKWLMCLPGQLRLRSSAAGFSSYKPTVRKT